MNHPNILVSDSDGIVTIEISRRDKKNAITGDMYRAMSAALGFAREKHHVRVALIRGQDDLFSAGNDLGDFLHRKANDPSAAIPFLHLLLPRLAGHQRAAELLLLGEPFDAATACSAGIVNRVVVSGQLMETALAAAQKLAGLPAQSLAVTKALMKRPPDRSAIEALNEEAIYFSDLMAEPAAKEIFSAFLEKRSPDADKIHGAKP